MHDVAIIGLGPTGVTLANLLAQQGLRVLALDREADIYPLPRAVHFDGECMRVFQSIGIADALQSQVRTSPGMKFINSEGRLLIDWSRELEVGPMGWYPSYRCHQPWLEKTLRQKLAEYAAADIRLKHELIDCMQTSDGVELRIQDVSNGEVLQEKARYVVGCDGARSIIRGLIGASLDDLQQSEQWVVVDVVLNRERPDLGDYSIQYCDPARPGTYVRGVGMRRRWELMLMPSDDPATITQPEAIWKLLSRWVTPDEAVLERPALYTFRAVVARGWRKDRLLIAGDAAHLTPPFMGQGMCAGIRDASNLAWKLGAVIRGEAGEELLDTYETEREPHAREFISTAVRLGQVIQTTTPEVLRQREEEFAQTQFFATPQPALGPGAHEGGTLGGRLIPQAVCADGSRTDDDIGYAHALLVAPSAVVAAKAMVNGAMPIVVATEPVLVKWMEKSGIVAALVRPDRYVAGVAATASELEQLVQSRRLQPQIAA
ncbi:bifunctional 3-(3-hydroxy-phenyl)propionate/3-hydroxycinnamic acid hydroxylase [Comamonas jiangduensis]|uniref:bifunctional 3-(3-hydroxy-phenyl)propionate/3-hydroxycinnamic acid hydroxylase MhpA n=1 Tax=Comamonas jiangduensis TaxID=1194168 RepID=UPI0024E0D941|nr:bifunctional 3-(3-hydroxy-phenyl)propionate/3-hydroxycinnamic acid hydroxylase [Comamonas jiangduensis]